MKRLIPFILIAAMLFPVLGRAFAASKPATLIVKSAAANTETPTTTPIDLGNSSLKDKSLADKQKAVSSGLLNIYSQLSSLSTQTQLTITQLAGNGINTDKAESDLLVTNVSLIKAKADIDTFSTVTVGKNSGNNTFDMLKNDANAAENTLHTAKTNLLTTLADIKALIPTLDTTGQS